jgi:hypothetical protein
VVRAVEGPFALSNNTQDATKFHYVISKLDDKYAAEMEDVITNPPSPHPLTGMTELTFQILLGT